MPGRRKLSPTTSSTATPAPWVVVPPRHPQAADATSGHAVVDRPEPLSEIFTAADLPGQFILSRSEDTVPAGWNVHRLRGWTLGSHASLPVTEMRTVDGTEVGWLLGSPINERAEFIEGAVVLPFDRFAEPRAMEAWISRLCGRFLVIWLTPLFERVYLDAGGLLSAVFAREHDLVASTPSLIPYTRGCTDDVGLLRRSRMPHGRAVLAFGLTSRYGVERLHPNHYLDLNRWAVNRHWPNEPLDQWVDPEEAIHVVSRQIRRHIMAASRRGLIQMALTAGYDSRSVMACSREFLPRTELITLAIPDRTGRLDVEMAKRIAARHGLVHRVIPHRDPTSHDLAAWLWRTGACLSEPRAWRGSPSYGQVRPVAEVTGSAGEAARVALWRDAEELKHGLTPAVLADCLNLPPTTGMLANASTWMSSYPASTPIQVLDGFYVEQWLGVAAGAMAYGDAEHIRNRIYPFVSRESLEVMMRLPEKYKLSRRFPVDLIRHEWPELLEIPFNREPGLRYHVYRARRKLWFWRRRLAGRRVEG